MDVRDSSTYQAIFDEGRIEEAQKLILMIGEQKFGSPSEATTGTITVIADLERLHQIQNQLFTAFTWDELLATA